MKRLLHAMRFAFNGIRVCVKKEANMRIHFFSTALVITLGILMHVSPFEWVLLGICAGSVLCMEMVNTAIELLCNEVTTQFRLSIKVIKDISAGAVLVNACISAICGAVIFLPKLFSLYKSLT